MNISAINALDSNFAIGHKDWISCFLATPQPDQSKENKQMEERQNEETTIILSLNASGSESIILLHNLKVVPSSHLQKKPIMRALHGFGDCATLVTLNYTKMIHLSSVTTVPP
jgi:hypothetical protein